MLVMFQMFEKKEYNSLEEFKKEFEKFLDKFNKDNKVFVKKNDVNIIQFNDNINQYISKVNYDEIMECFEKEFTTLESVYDSITTTFRQQLNLNYGYKTKEI